MKQNTQVIRTSTRLGHMDSHHVHVMVGYWDVKPPLVDPIVRTKAWSRWQLVYTVGGKALLNWPGENIELHPRTAVLLSPHTEYTYRTDPKRQEWQQYSAVFLPRPHWHEWLQWPELAPGIMKLEVKEDSGNKQICRTLDYAIMLAETPRPRWEDFTLAALEKVLLLFRELVVSAKNESPKKHVPHSVDPRLHAAIEFIEENQAKSVTWPQIARVAGVSYSFLGILFQKHLRTTPQQYLDSLRINKAQRLLRETGQRISEIGYAAGYDSPSHFCSRFRKLTGQTPGEYRKALK